jgi:uncharacterized membrane protein
MRSMRRTRVETLTMSRSSFAEPVRSADEWNAAQAIPALAPSFVITPHRSLNNGQQCRVFGGIACVLLTLQLGFLLSDAWPISLFFGADLALLGVAFWSSRRAGRQSEHIRIEAGSIHIERRGWRMPASPAPVPLYGVALHRTDDPDFGCLELAVVHRGRREVIAAALSPAERQSFSHALQDTLSTHGAPVRLTITHRAPRDPR